MKNVLPVTQNLTDAEVGQLAADLALSGLELDRSPWVALTGGRCNRLWRVQQSGRNYVVKLYRTGRATPLFQNCVGAEVASLERLGPLGLAPNLVKATHTRSGPVLVYHHQEGRTPVGPLELAASLRDLHGIPVEQQAIGPVWGVAQFEEALDVMLSQLGRSTLGRLPARPVMDTSANPKSVQLHGDPVLGNAVAGPDGVVLIDWQCPRFGDPLWDLAVLTSPSMLWLYGGNRGPGSDTDAVMAAYADPEISERLFAFRPFLHYLFAVYALWMAEHGEVAYRSAAEIELESLETCGG